MILRWALQGLRAQKKTVLFFVLNLSLGLFGFLLLEAFRDSMEDLLRDNSKGFLSADLSVSSRRKLTDTEVAAARQVIGQAEAESRLYEFFSMIRTSQGSRLVQVKAIDNNYPLYGNLELGSGQKIEFRSDRNLNNVPHVWVYPEILAQLGLKVGDTIQVGDLDFVIEDTVVNDSTQTFRLSTLAPKIFVGLDQVKGSSFIQKGSTFTEALLFKIPDDTRAGELSKELFKQIPDPAVQVMSFLEAGQESGRAISYFSDYLSLVSSVALFLSLAGALYIYRNFFRQKIKSISIYNVLGLQFNRLFLILIVEVLLIALLSSLIAAALALAAFPVLSDFIKELVSFDIPLKISARTAQFLVLVSVLGSLSVAGFFLFHLRKLRGSELFQEVFNQQIALRKAQVFYLLIPLTLFWLLSCYQAHSFRTGSVFIALLFVSVLALIGLGYGALRMFAALLPQKPWFFHHAKLQLQRKGGSHMASFVAIGFGALLMTLLPQLKLTIEREIESPEASKLPALFMFDIQDEQLQSLQQALKLEFPSDLQFSPMVRARIISINQEPFEKKNSSEQALTREEENESRSRNRGFNLSYREHLSASENLESGALWTEPFRAESGALPGISLESRFADRLKLKLGDVLKFDIQGVEVEGQVTSLRSVKWNSFQPNFFVLFQPGVIDEAPKSWLVSLPSIAKDQLDRIQGVVSSKYPNVSILDVNRTVKKMLEMTQKMDWSLNFMAYLSFITGFFVLYSIVSFQVEASRWDLNMQKILGARFLENAGLFWIQYFAVGLVASVIGAALSLIVTAGLSYVIFETNPVFDLSNIAITVALATALSFALAVVSTLRTLRESPLVLLHR